MRFGFYLPTRGPLATRRQLKTFLETGEAVGFSSVMVADHIVVPAKIESAYPYTVKGNFLSKGECMEQLTLMAFVAAATETLRIVSSVMIVPHRNPIMTAKSLATTDVLSEGRVTVGVGVGWMAEEFEALDAPDFKARGKSTDEYIAIWKKLWTGEAVSHKGEFYSFDDLYCQPAPLQSPHPPIWIGGHSNPALRRVARLGDGWHPVGATAASPLPPVEMQQKLAQLREMTEAEGRDFDKLTISYKAPFYDGGQPPAGEERRLFTGGASAALDDIAAMRDIGVHELVFDFRGDDLDSSLTAMRRFAEDVMAKVPT
ncbi:MAG: TIGR03619 family F420-dependent LLM class oxidoreductase [Alphaproteobacteria bacterium]